VVEVAELSRPEQRFRCVPYAAILRAGQCIERQKEHKSYGIDHYRVADGRRRTYQTDSERRRGNPGGRTYLGKCRDCELGQQVAARLGEVIGER